MVMGTPWGASVGRFRLDLEDVIVASDELAQMCAFLDHASGHACGVADGSIKDSGEHYGRQADESAWAGLWERYGCVP
jgi:hypothetical protein